MNTRAENSAKLPYRAATDEQIANAVAAYNLEMLDHGLKDRCDERAMTRALGAALSAEQSKDAATAERDALAERLHHEALSTGKGTCPPSWSGHWRDWYRLRADEIIAQRTQQAFDAEKSAKEIRLRGAAQSLCSALWEPTITRNEIEAYVRELQAALDAK